MCLSILSVEDVEDVYMIGFMITGLLLFGVGGFLFYRKAQKESAAILAIEKLLTEVVCRAVNTQTDAIRELIRKQEDIPGHYRRSDSNLEKFTVRLGCNGPTN